MRRQLGESQQFTGMNLPVFHFSNRKSYPPLPGFRPRNLLARSDAIRMVLNLLLLFYAQQELMQRPGDGVVLVGWIVEERVREKVYCTRVKGWLDRNEQKCQTIYVIFFVSRLPE
jgi:hypothetical protein